MRSWRSLSAAKSPCLRDAGFLQPHHRPDPGCFLGKMRRHLRQGSPRISGDSSRPGDAPKNHEPLEPFLLPEGPEALAKRVPRQQKRRKVYRSSQAQDRPCVAHPGRTRSTEIRFSGVWEDIASSRVNPSEVWEEKVSRDPRTCQKNGRRTRARHSQRTDPRPEEF